MREQAGRGGMPPSPDTIDPPLPPVTEMAVVTLILIVIGGIYLASSYPGRYPLWPAWVLLATAVVMQAATLYLLTRLGEFAWDKFVLVGKWSLLAYVIIAGMIELSFVLDGTPAKVLVVITAMLVIYAIDIPLILAFSVARYQVPRSQRRAA